MASIFDLIDYLPNKFFTAPLRGFNQFFEGVAYKFTPEANATTNYNYTYRGFYGGVYDIKTGSSSSSAGLALQSFNLGEFDTLPVPNSPRAYGGVLTFNATYGSQTLSYTWTVADQTTSLGNPSYSAPNTNGNIIYFGNDGKNNVQTGSGADYIDGGEGIDSLSGGAGNDVYFVTPGDKVFEKAGGGIDTIVADKTYLIPAGQSVENFIAVATKGIKLYGNEVGQTIVSLDKGDLLDGRGGADVLVGFGGADRLIGGAGNDKIYGGDGNDLLSGGTGQDRFHFDTALTRTNIDRIADFKPADDSIVLDKSSTLFSKVGGLGTLTVSQFKDITDPKTKLDANDRILYDHDTGRLYYDADGSGSSAKVTFAILENSPILTHSDFLIV